ncbi:hypothetical protein Bpfe_021691 [Biomphalaria pfeifferi]|uniref:Uncharacterized protein n=1 Tax=Biomphalaria pfeifferi TaxID=112525 RepID=A0AAD8B6I0_BIOPF|nr:hypothetical protein Bpfe_021691 [Biomphalaria pfeifferi]
METRPGSEHSLGSVTLLFGSDREQGCRNISSHVSFHLLVSGSNCLIGRYGESGVTKIEVSSQPTLWNVVSLIDLWNHLNSISPLETQTLNIDLRARTHRLVNAVTCLTAHTGQATAVLLHNFFVVVVRVFWYAEHDRQQQQVCLTGGGTCPTRQIILGFGVSAHVTWLGWLPRIESFVLLNGERTGSPNEDWV